jgi:Capsule assembly protein Wzi
MRKWWFNLTLAANLAAAAVLPGLRAQQPSGPSSGDSPAATARSKMTAVGSNAGSPFVELDSWIYPSMLRLAALGYVRSDFSDMRPWTRMECAVMIQEAAGRLEVDSAGSSSEAQRLYAALKEEFQDELRQFDAGGNQPSWQLESLYSKSMGIRGRPLNDSYHFGQTIINNAGRPYQEGFNNYLGYSAYATAGPLVVYSRGEYQHAPAEAGYTLPVRQAIAAADGNPVQPSTAIETTSQFRLLDTYAALDLSGWNFSVGKQSLWWAPNSGGALLFSNNAEPIYMGRVHQLEPFRLPWLFRLMGPTKVDLFFGKLSGNQFPRRPLVHGEKISFKPTANLELSFSRTAEFGGVGRALTLGALFHSYFSFQSSAAYPASQNPGERNGGFSFSYRIPGLRDWLTVYGDLMSRDDPNPLDAPRRAAWNPGLYLAWIPYVPRLDFRMEAVNTDPPSSPAHNGQFDYWEGFYHDLYTNRNNLIGDWIGREGLGFQAWSTYWFSPKNTLLFGYRHAKVDGRFIPYGETLNDGYVSLNWWMRKGLQLSASVQYEKWSAPLLAPRPQTNWTSSIEVSLWPKSAKR